jgi:hypothetical protein
MASSTRAATSTKLATDLTAIDGIGPTLAKRLQAAGIATVGNLAGQTAQRVASMLGPHSRVTAQRIRDEDWIGQARKLARAGRQPAQRARTRRTAADEQSPRDRQVSSRRHVPGRRSSTTPAPGTQQHSLAFHVAFFIGPDDRVRRTEVHDDQTDTVEQWAGWDLDSLTAYLNERLGQRLATATNTIATTAEPEPKPVTFHTLGPVAQGTHRSFGREGDPLRVLLDFSVHDIIDLETAPRFDYVVSVRARKVGQPEGVQIGTQHGAGTLDRNIIIEWPGEGLPCGLHYFQADLYLHPHNQPGNPAVAHHRHRGALIHIAPARQPARAEIATSRP